MITRRGLFTGLIAAAGIAAGCAADRVMSAAPHTNAAKPTIVVSSVAKPGSMPMPAQAFVGLFREYTRYLKPVWGVDADFVYGTKPDPKAWNIIFVDNLVDAPGALAYHAFDPTVSPLPYALVQTANKEIAVTVTATHELGEMLVDPGCQMWAGMAPPSSGPYETWRGLLALEIADPVEQYTFNVGETPVSDFVYPAYFQPWRDGQIDQCNRISYHQLGVGGYQIVREDSDIGQIVNLGNGVFGKRHVGDEPRCSRFSRIVTNWRLPSQAV